MTASTTATSSSEATLRRLEERVGRDVVERIVHLDAMQAHPGKRADGALAPADRDASFDADVLMAGGGLSLLIAAELARLGVRVLVVERTRAGQAHREWNASDDELRPLVRSEIVSDEELRSLIIAQYTHGICAFHGGTPRRVEGVLDRAVAAGPLLEKTRAVCVARGVQFIDGADVDAIGASPFGVRVGWRARSHDGHDEKNGGPSGRGEALVRWMIDARGASSPYATADLICPTVGGVVRGLARGTGAREVDETRGDILVTTEPVCKATGLQYVWEGFPGHPGEITVYLFAYANRARGPKVTLVDLYTRFFDSIADYKDGEPTLERATFGYIPGWSRLSRAPQSPWPRVLLVGDAAARHSPLTFCGFGAMLRSFQPIARGLAHAVSESNPLLPSLSPARSAAAIPTNAIANEAIHEWTGALAAMMASGAMPGNSLNALLDAAFGVLEEMGNEDFAALLQDRMTGDRFTHFLRKTAARQPRVYADVFRALGPAATARWGFRVARALLA